MFKNLKQNNYKEESVQSYLGLLIHGGSNKLKNNIENFAKININVSSSK
jgi:hypothetical protein